MRRFARAGVIAGLARRTATLEAFKIPTTAGALFSRRFAAPGDSPSDHPLYSYPTAAEIRGLALSRSL